jgi:hypothetical protein
MALTGNELTFECEGCHRELFLDQLSMADLKCIRCITKELAEACQQNTSLASTPAK